MRGKGFISILLIFALLIGGMSLGGGKALDNLKKFIETKKESEVVSVPPVENPGIHHIINASNANVGLYQSDRYVALMSFYSNETLNRDDYQAYVIHYEFNKMSGYTYPSFYFGAASSSSEDVNFRFPEAYSYDGDFSITASEVMIEFDNGLVEYEIRYYSNFKGKSITHQFIDSVTLVYAYVEGAWLQLYYVNGEYIGYKLAALEEYIYGLNLFYTTSGASSASFESISFSSIDKDYTGDLLNIVDPTFNITDSEDFNKFILGQTT